MIRLKALFAFALCACFMLVDPNAAPARQGPPEQPDMTVDAAARKEVIENLLKRLNDAYVFPETAAKIERAVRERLDKGEYDQITSAKQFAEKLTADMQEVSHDKHLRVRYSHQPIPERAGGPRQPSAEERERVPPRDVAHQLRLPESRAAAGQHRLRRVPRLLRPGGRRGDGRRGLQLPRQHRRHHLRPAQERRRRPGDGRAHLLVPLRGRARPPQRPPLARRQERARRGVLDAARRWRASATRARTCTC